MLMILIGWDRSNVLHDLSALLVMFIPVNEKKNLRILLLENDHYPFLHSFLVMKTRYRNLWVFIDMRLPTEQSLMTVPWQFLSARLINNWNEFCMSFRLHTKNILLRCVYNELINYCMCIFNNASVLAVHYYLLKTSKKDIRQCYWLTVYNTIYLSTHKAWQSTI